MGNSGSAPHDFSEDLKKLCGEGEQISDKKQVKEVKKTSIVLKGSFGSARIARLGSAKDTGVQLVVGMVGKTYVAPALFHSIAQLAQVDDAHVARLVNVCTTCLPLLLSLEYCAGGDLEAYLEQNDKSLALATKIDMLAQVADGMATLEAQGIVHGHLSLRSVLMFEGGAVCKVANVCGELSPPLDYFKSPQQLRGAGWQSSQDVWSFAMLVFRVTTFSSNPPTQPGVVPAFTAPITDDDSLVEVLERCLSIEPVQRPDFFWLRADFEERAAKK